MLSFQSGGGAQSTSSRKSARKNTGSYYYRSCKENGKLESNTSTVHVKNVYEGALRIARLKSRNESELKKLLANGLHVRQVTSDGQKPKSNEVKSYKVSTHDKKASDAYLQTLAKQGRPAPSLKINGKVKPNHYREVGIKAQGSSTATAQKVKMP